MLQKIRGFTLVELMVVIIIIGILAAVAIPNFVAWRKKAGQRDKTQIEQTLNPIEGNQESDKLPSLNIK